MNDIRAWIDAKDHRPIVAAIVIVELPVLIAMTGLCVWVRAPWFTMPIIITGALLIWAWVVLVVSALTTWFPGRRDQRRDRSA